jgi:hypothetical protein
VDSEAVGGVLFSVLDCRCVKTYGIGGCWRWEPLTRPRRVFNSRETFFSVASARGISTTSVIWLPSPSTNLALKDPRSAAATAVTSCCTCERSSSSLRCLLEGGGATVAILKLLRG